MKDEIREALYNQALEERFQDWLATRPARAPPRRGAQLNPADLPRVRHPRRRRARLRRRLRPRASGRRSGRSRVERGQAARRASAATAGSPPTRTRAALTEGLALDRARRARHRRVPDAAHVLLALPLGPRRRHPGDRQPQSRRLQRLQDLPRHASRSTASRSRTCADGIEAGRFRAAAAARVEARADRARVPGLRRRARRRGSRGRSASSSTPATAPPGRSRRRSTAGSAREVTRALHRRWTGASRTTIPTRPCPRTSRDLIRAVRRERRRARHRLRRRRRPHRRRRRARAASSGATSCWCSSRATCSRGTRARRSSPR